MEELITNYWRTVAKTRTSGRIAQSVKDRVRESWAAFDEDVVKEALRIHIDRYPTYKETYTIGIMRNLQKQKAAGKPVSQGSRNNFNKMAQNDYDFEALEKGLLAN